MADFAQLVMTADSRGLKQGEQALNDLAATAEKTEGRTAKAADGLAKAQQEVGKQSIFASQQTRMFSMQLSQVAQQASATGNWIQAIAIQLPDMTLAFGTVGIAAGVAAGALLPLVANLVGVGDEAEKFEDSLQRVKDVADSLKQPLDTIKMSVKDLADEYGSGAERAYEFALAQAQIRVGDAQRALEQQSSILRDVTEQYLTSAEAGYTYEKRIAAISDAFGVNRQQADSLKDAFRDLFVADTFSEQQASLENIIGLLNDYGVDLKSLPPEFSEAADKMLSLSNETDHARQLADQLTNAAAGIVNPFSAAADEAGRLVENMSLAQAMAMRQVLETQGGVAGLSEQYRQYGEGRVAAEATQRNIGELYGKSGNILEELGVYERTARAARAAARRGRSSKVSEEDREVQRLFESTRTEAEKYSAELEKLDSLYSRHKIDADLYGRAVEQLGEKYKDTSESAKFFSDIGEDLKHGLIDAIVEGDNLADTFENLAKSIAKAALEAAFFGTGPLGSNKGGSAGGAILGEIFHLNIRSRP